MNEKLPDWFKLIKAWMGEGRDGLTLPFLVGARKLIIGELSASRKDAELLIDEIISNPVEGYIVFLRWCNNIQSVVLRIESNFYKFDNLGIEVKKPGSDKISLIIEKNIAAEWSLPKNAQNLLNHLLGHVKKQLIEGNFSKYWTEDGLTYGPFGEQDTLFIKEALEIP